MLKKSLLALFAIVVVAASAQTSASYTGDVATYESNKANRTVSMNKFGYVSMFNLIYYVDGRFGKVKEIVEEGIICRTGGEACYASATALRAFGIDVDSFVRGQEYVTGRSVVFTPLFDAIK